MRREVELKEKEVSHKLSQLQLEQGHAQLLHLRMHAKPHNSAQLSRIAVQFRQLQQLELQHS